MKNIKNGDMNTEDLHRNMIAFGEWLLKNDWKPYSKLGWYNSELYTSSQWITTEELYQIFIDSKK